jgi:thiol:disulfide interchange protein
MPPADLAGARAATTRARPTALLVIAGVLLVARIATGVYEASRPPRPGGLVHWVSAGEVEALTQGSRKPVFYDFSASWCVPCRQMDGELFSNAGTADFINDTFIAVRVTDDDQSPASVAIRRRHQVTALPTLVVVHPDSTEPKRLQGYPGRRQAIAFLRFAAAGGQRAF